MSRQMPNTLCIEPGCRSKAVEGNRCVIHVKNWNRRLQRATGVVELPKDWAYRKSIVLKRDGYKCVQCGSTYGLEVDHVQPRSEGGGHNIGNLQTLCKECHSVKTQRQTKEYVSNKQKSAIDIMRSIQDGNYQAPF